MKTRITITLDEKWLDKVKAEAEREGRSVSNMIETMIRQYPAKKSERRPS
jgi:metal-responsive CopG/Arc/MetJ family transcriptional regulator